MSEPEPIGDLAARAEALRREQTGRDEADPFWRSAPEPDPEALAEAMRIRWERTIPPRFADAKITQLAEPLCAEIKEWTQLAPSGPNLVLFGPVGTGKTHAAAATARLLVEQSWTLEFWPVVRLLDRLRPGNDEPDPYRPAARADLLILDDLGAERATEWTAERLYALVNDRWLNRRPTIVTTNMPPDKLTAAIGDRLASRLLGGALIARLSGQDRRMTR